MSDLLKEFEEILDYRFTDKHLLDVALTHSSTGTINNERLEYLGDAVLGLVIADVLYRRFTQASEGELTQLRSSLVAGKALAQLALELSMGDFIKLGKGEMKSGGQVRESILAGTMEAIIAAIYLDAGFDRCCLFIDKLYRDLLEQVSPKTLKKDPKTTLQELLQARKEPLPNYQIIAEKGGAHTRQFTVECMLSSAGVIAQAVGSSKQNAEQAAASKVLERLQDAGC